MCFSKLYHGDCLEVMQKFIDKGVKFDAIITDPPYELDNHGGGLSAMTGRATKVKDDISFIANGFNCTDVFDKMLLLCKVPNLIIFCSNKQITKTMKYFEDRGLSTTLLVWNKTNAAPLCNGKYISDLEFIVYVRDKGATFNNDTPTKIKRKFKSYPFVSPKQRQHPTEKPVKLMEDLVNVHSIEKQVILDPFMGSGTTGVACKNLHRNFVGIELDDKYFEIAKQRIFNKGEK